MRRLAGIFIVAASFGLATSASAVPIEYSVLEPTTTTFGAPVFEIDFIDQGISAAELSVDLDTLELVDFRVLATDDSIGLILDAAVGIADLGGGFFQVDQPADATLFLGDGSTAGVDLSGFVFDISGGVLSTVEFFGQTDTRVTLLNFAVSEGDLSGITPSPSNPIPEPTSGVLFMTGLILVGHFVRDRRSI